MRKVITILVALCAIAYIFIALRLLIFRNTAQFSNLLENIGLPRHYSSYNLVPFRTIIGYFKALVDRSMTRGIPIQNIIGNLLAFMPLGFFLPFFSKKMSKLIIFAMTVSVSIITIELLQFILRVGSMDIDDFILNLLGALIGFAICTHKPVSNLLKMRSY
ncbi:MAG: VanZ family protein [Oscillospiraceae bacterium]|nr:VanZ family protein [Oscillospiraceae bacterium]